MSDMPVRDEETSPRAPGSEREEDDVNKTALFIRHQARAGSRDDVRRVWEKHVRPRVEANPAHEAYFFCYDDNDPNLICVFQLYTDVASMQDFPSGAWYADYLSEVSRFIEAPPQIAPATLVWAKETGNWKSRG